MSGADRAWFAPRLRTTRTTSSNNTKEADNTNDPIYENLAQRGLPSAYAPATLCLVLTWHVAPQLCCAMPGMMRSAIMRLVLAQDILGPGPVLF